MFYMNHMHNYRRKPLKNKLQIPKMVQQATKNPIFPSVTVGHTNYEKQPWVTQFEKLRLFKQILLHKKLEQQVLTG